MDLVESVRLMEQDWDNFVRRWQQLVQHAEQHILPQYGAASSRCLGDGLMLAFAIAPNCAQAALALLNFSQQAHGGWCPSQRLHLRMGGHLASFVTDRHDIYGTDVNLTPPFCGLAGSDQIVISAAFRDRLLPTQDSVIEDLGERYLKHVSRPVHAYRITPPGEACVLDDLPGSGSALLRTTAVVPRAAPG
jgi:class 3 adenylate cyclase